MDSYVCAIERINEISDYCSGDNLTYGHVILSKYCHTISDRCIPYIKIDCSDVYKDETGFITNDQIDELYKFIRKYWYIDRLIVSCDAGISRSPAVAIAISEYLGYDKASDLLRKQHPHFNEDIYVEIRNRFKELDKRGKKI